MLIIDRFRRRPVLSPMIRNFLICKPRPERRVIHHYHEHHHALGHDSVGEARDTHELHDSIAGLCIHICPTDNAHQEPDHCATRQSIKQASVLFDPCGVASVGNGPAVRVKQNHLEAVQVDEFASGAPPAEEKSMDGQMQEEAEVGHIVVPKEDTLHVEREVRVAVLIDEARVIVRFVIRDSILVDRCLVSWLIRSIIVSCWRVFLQYEHLQSTVTFPLWHLVCLI